MWFLVLFAVSFASADPYGYLSQCPNANGHLHITEQAVRDHMFVVLQIHEQATPTQIAYMHRRRYSVKRAARLIGTDPEVDLKRRKTMVFMDGYTDSAHAPSVRILMGNFAAMGYNTIALDAQEIYLFIYPVAIRLTYQVGNITALFLKELIQYGLRGEDIELVGISLGGQTVSFVAKNFYRLTGQKIGRIYSMDPSGPCYRSMPPEYHLTPTDADLVQVLHTNNEGFGNGEAQGHLDFYFNGGEFQDFIFPAQPWCDELCSHITSVFYLYTALRLYPDKFVGIKCKNVQQARDHKCYDNYPYETNVLGSKADPSKPGIYYVPVKADAPFFAPDNFMETKPVYSLINHDAFSGVENFVLSERS